MLSYYMYIVPYLTALLAQQLFAIDTGISYEITRFQQDIEAATPILEDAIAKMKSDFTENIGNLSCSATLTSTDEYLFSKQASSDSDSNTLNHTPVSQITSGWVCHADTYGSSSDAEFHELNSTEDQRFILQITFDSDSAISPTLQGRTVTFIAYGLGPEHPYIESTSGTDPTPSTTEMSSISGFH